MLLFRKLKNAAVAVDGRQYPAVDYKVLEGETIVTLSETQPTQKILNEMK